VQSADPLPLFAFGAGVQHFVTLLGVDATE